MSDDDERFHNFLIYKFWGTDKEMEDIGPLYGIILVILLVFIVSGAICNNQKMDKPPQTNDKIEDKKPIEIPAQGGIEI